MRGESRHAAIQELDWPEPSTLFCATLVHLPRHADHHFAPTRSHQALQPRAKSPHLPSVDAAVLPPALVPPLWFRV